MSEMDGRESAPQYPGMPSAEPPAPAKEASAQAAGGAPQPSVVPSEADILEALHDVIDPELGIDVVNLGLVYQVRLNGTKVVLDMTLTSAACPLTDVIEDQTAQALAGLVTSSRINWVWLPPWGPERITPEGREMLQALGFNV